MQERRARPPGARGALDGGATEQAVPPSARRSHAAKRLMLPLGCGLLALAGVGVPALSAPPSAGPGEGSSARTGRASGWPVAGPVLRPPATASAERRGRDPGPTARTTGTTRSALTALTALLDRRAAAMRAGDRTGWLAAVDPAAARFRAAQARVFDAVRKVPLARWGYRVDGPGPALPAVRRRALGGDAELARVTLHYRVAGVDGDDVRRRQVLTVVRRAGGWRIAADGDGRSGSGSDDRLPRRSPGGSLGAATDRDLWDFGPVRVARGRDGVVLGHPRAGSAALRAYAADADRAVAAVSRSWGRDWRRRLVLLVPRDQREMASLLGGDGAGLSQIAAVTTGQVGGGTDRTSADRIVVNPDTFRTLTPVGRRVVLTHEATHVATRQAAPAGVPIWLTEGYADYVAYAGTAVPVRLAAAEVLAQVRAGRGPRRLPTEADFDPSRGRITSSYESAWLACRLAAQRRGTGGPGRLYRAIAAGGGGPGATAAAFRDVLGTTPERFVSDWRAYVSRLAASAGSPTGAS